MTGTTGEPKYSPSAQRNVMFFRDLTLSISEWIPFGQNAISTLNGILDSVKGVRDSLLTGKVDEAPETSEFSLRPFFTRVSLEDFDRYDWIRFSAQIEYMEVVEQVRRMGVHVDKSGFVNYCFRVDSLAGKGSDFPVDAVAALLADVVEDTSTMMEALLTQFQQRCLGLAYGSGKTAQRDKFIVGITSGLLPEETSATRYNDGEERQSEIDQLLGSSYDFLDLPGGEMLIMGTYGLIYVARDARGLNGILSFYSALRSLQMFQTIFFGRLRYLWDVIRDIREVVLRLTSEEAIGDMEQRLSQLNADIVLVEEINDYMRASADMMERTWARKRASLEAASSDLVRALEVDRELKVIKGTIDDMVMVSGGLVDEIQGIRDMLGTIAEKRMRDLNRLMTDNVQQGSEAQQIMLANIRESRYSSAALKILSAISAGALGMKISDIIMEALDNEGLHPPFSDSFAGSYFHLAFGFTLWLILALAFFTLIRKGTARVKRQKLAKQFNLNIRFPVDARVPREVIRGYLAKKELVFYNVETTALRVGWHHRERKADHEVLWVLIISYDPQTEVLHYVHANTEDRRGDAQFTTDTVLGDLVAGGVIGTRTEASMRQRMGVLLEGGVVE